MQTLKPLIEEFMAFAQNRFGFDEPPKLFFKQDIENSKDVFGKTAYYDPQNKSVTVFVTNRHPKDIMRSLSHELVHHTQNLRGDLTPEKCGEMGPGYAQTNPHMREMERQAFEEGNLCFRDFCDEYKKQLQEVKFLKESKKMTKKINKKSLEKIVRRLLEERKKNISEQAPGASQYGRDLAAALQDPVAYLKYFDRDANGNKIDPLEYSRQILSGQGAIERFAADGSSPSGMQTAFGQSDLIDAAGKLAQMAKPAVAAGAPKEKMASYRGKKYPVLNHIGSFGKAYREARKRGLDIFAYQRKGKKLGFYATGLKKSKPKPEKFDREKLRKTLDSAGLYAAGDERLSGSDALANTDAMDKRMAALMGDDDDTKVAKKKSAPLQEDELKEGHCTGKRDDDGKCKGCPKCEPAAESEVKEEAEKPDYIDIDGDGDKEESMKKAAKDKKNESKIYTPEKEKMLYESRFNNRNEQIFDKLKKLWTK